MRSAINVLNRNGFNVVVPSNQVCCGAINSHAGDLDTASNLARKNIDAFGINEETLIVTMSAGCGARLKGYHELLKEDWNILKNLRILWQESEMYTNY